jgi:HEAT repeat protein
MSNMTKRRFIVGLALGLFAFATITAQAKPKTEEQLIAELDSPKEKVVFDAMAQLEKEYPTSTAYLPKLKALLTDNRLKIQRKAARVLGALHAEVSETDLQNICALLASNDRDAKMDGLKALRGLKSQSVISKMTPLLQDPNPNVARDACRTLAVVADKSVVPLIEPLLQSPDKKVQKDAQDAIFALKNK